MKKLFKILIFSFTMLTFFFIVNEQNAFAQTVKEEEVAISVTGMRCVGCELGIERELQKLPGVISVKADNVRSEVVVKYRKDTISINKIVDKINELGFRAELPTKPK